MAYNETMTFDSVSLLPTEESLVVQFAKTSGSTISAVSLPLAPTVAPRNFADLNAFLGPEFEIIDVAETVDFLRLFSILYDIKIEVRMNEVDHYEFGALPDGSGTHRVTTRPGKRNQDAFYPNVMYYASSMRRHYTTEANIGVMEKQVAIIQSFVEKHHTVLKAQNIHKIKVMLVRCPNHLWSEISEARWVSIPDQQARRDPIPFFSSDPNLPLVTRDRYAATIGVLLDASGRARYTSEATMEAILLPPSE